MRITLFMVQRGLSSGGGSGEVTSRAHPAISPVCRAWMSASLSTSFPRPTFIRNAVFFIRCNSLVLMMLSVSSVRGRARVTKSLFART